MSSAPQAAAEPRLLPARMLNEFAYCPRLFHIEFVEGLFEDNADTVEGRSVHRRVEKKEEPLPEAGPDAPPAIARSVTLSSEALGVIAKIDLLEADGAVATPVDTKRGQAPDLPEGAYEPERVQLCLQGLLLREHGFRCDQGSIYFAGSRKRVSIAFTEELVGRTTELTAAARAAMDRKTPPPPLADSPKCPRCSLVGICLPDEVNYLLEGCAQEGERRDEPPRAPRRLLAARPDSFPFYVQGQGLAVSKKGETLVVSEKGTPVREAHLKDISHVAIFGNNQITTPALQALCGAGIPVSWFSQGAWFYGVLHSLSLPNILLRVEQFRAKDDPVRSLALARGFISGKIANCRTLLMRNHPDPPATVLDGLAKHVRLAAEAETADALLGIEGNAARLYFGSFGGMLKPRPGEAAPAFDFATRNRRPPRDPVNAMLSFAYSMLVREATALLFAVGFDPFLGFYHQPRPGRPGLALDLMEEFRPIVADSVVLNVVNNGEAGPDDFVTSRAGCAMKPAFRARLIEAYERRMDTLVTHPVFDYRMSYRRILEVQARLIGRFLAGEIEEYPAFRTR